ncbi:PEP-CTERM sorting domain-containing protein [Novosphingobium sp. BL-8A]|uniref:PEP-CTERM sorting domain-containing protein n=1 Tax=Novosphingobium sp. BL-8A TaxID=3127639 RepID=UPI003757F525
MLPQTPRPIPHLPGMPIRIAALAAIALVPAPAIALVPAPAFAADAAVLPEPSGLMLFGIGVAGVWLGRRFSRGKSKD